MTSLLDQIIHPIYWAYHVPNTFDWEAFGQVYIEAMLSSVPYVITKRDVAYDYAILRSINYAQS